MHLIFAILLALFLFQLIGCIIAAISQLRAFQIFFAVALTSLIASVIALVLWALWAIWPGVIAILIVVGIDCASRKIFG